MALDQLSGPQLFENERALLESMFLTRLMVELGDTWSISGDGCSSTDVTSLRPEGKRINCKLEAERLHNSTLHITAPERRGRAAALRPPGPRDTIAFVGYMRGLGATVSTLGSAPASCAIRKIRRR